MTLLKILFYFFISAFTFKYRVVSMELSEDGEETDIILWGVATKKGWQHIKEEAIQGKQYE